MARSTAATSAQHSVCARFRAVAETRRFRHSQCDGLVVDRHQQPRFTIGLVGNSFRDRELPKLALRSQIYSAHHRLPSLARRRCPGAVELLDFSGRNNLRPPLVRHRARRHRFGHCRQTGRPLGGTIVNLLAFSFILTSLVTFVAGQLFLKRAMESTAKTDSTRARFIRLLGGGIFLMTISFFLTLGLLQRFDLSYLYPFQGLSVLIISIAAAIVLREKLTLQLAIGAALISIGIVLVSLS